MKQIKPITVLLSRTVKYYRFMLVLDYLILIVYSLKIMNKSRIKRFRKKLGIDFETRQTVDHRGHLPTGPFISCLWQ